MPVPEGWWGSSVEKNIPSDSKWWLRDVPEFWYEWTSWLTSPHTISRVDDSKIQVWNLLDLPEWVLDLEDIKRIRFLLWNLDKANNDVRLKSLNEVWKILWLPEIYKVDDLEVEKFLKSWYNHILVYLLEYENRFTYLRTNKLTPSELKTIVTIISWYMTNHIPEFISFN